MRLQATADTVKVESDERGFELHVETYEGDVFVFNIHGIAEDVYDTVKRRIGPWLQEMHAAKAEYNRAKGHPLCPDEDGHCQYGRDDTCPGVENFGPWPGESVWDYYQRTGQDGPLREVADALNKARKEA